MKKKNYQNRIRNETRKKYRENEWITKEVKEIKEKK